MKFSDLKELVILLVWINILFLEVPVVRITGEGRGFAV